MSNISAYSQQTQSGSNQVLHISSTIIVLYIYLLLLPDIIDSKIEKLVNREAFIIIMFTAFMMNTCYFISIPVTYIFLHRDMRRMLLERFLRCFISRNERTSNGNVIAFTEGRVQIAVV